MSTDTDTNPSQINRKEIDGLIRSAFGAGDSGSTQAIQNLTWIHQAKVSQLMRSAAALKKQYGAESAETKAADAAVDAGNTCVASMTAIHLQIATPSPQVSTTGWVLHGRVFNTQLQPAANFTVFLIDARKKFKAQFGFAYTDDTGYFLLNYAGAKDKKPVSGQLFVEIANKKGQPVYLSATEFQPISGAAIYQNIILPPEEKPLGELPKKIRRGTSP